MTLSWPQLFLYFFSYPKLNLPLHKILFKWLQVSFPLVIPHYLFLANSTENRMHVFYSLSLVFSSLPSLSLSLSAWCPAMIGALYVHKNQISLFVICNFLSFFILYVNGQFFSCTFLFCFCITYRYIYCICVCIFGRGTRPFVAPDARAFFGFTAESAPFLLVRSLPFLLH